MYEKTKILTLVCLAFATALVCFQFGKSAHAGGFTLAHPYRPDSSVGIWATKFANCVSDTVGIPVEVYGNGTLGGAGALPYAVKSGKVDIAVMPVHWLQQTWPAMAVLTMPGIVTGPDQAILLSSDSNLMREIDEIGAERAGFHVVGLGWQYGMLIGSEETVSDISGKIVGGYGSAWNELAEELGASELRISPYEILDALNYGAVDGAIISSYHLEALDQLRKFGGAAGVKAVTWSDDFVPFVHATAIVLSTSAVSFWGEHGVLDEVRNVCVETSREFNQNAAKEAHRAVSDFESSGAMIKAFDDAARAKWQKAMDGLIDKYNLNEDALMLAERVSAAKR